MTMKGRAARAAIALSMAAALAGALPPAALGAEGSADTPVYLDVERAVLRVAVPMDVKMVAPAGGGSLACPSNYGIWNCSTNVDVFVSKIEAAYSEANARGALWRIVDDSSLVGPGRETDGAELANVAITLRAQEAEGGADEVALDAEAAVLPASAWRVARASSEEDPTFFPIAFAEDSACSIVRDAERAYRMSEGDAALGIDAASAFRMKFTITTMRPQSAGIEGSL